MTPRIRPPLFQQPYHPSFLAWAQAHPPRSLPGQGAHAGPPDHVIAVSGLGLRVLVVMLALVPLLVLAVAALSVGFLQFYVAAASTTPAAAVTDDPAAIAIVVIQWVLGRIASVTPTSE